MDIEKEIAFGYCGLNGTIKRVIKDNPLEFFSPNLTGKYVSRIEKKALLKLREKFEQG